MFKQDLCDLCGDCLTKCQWMDAGQEQAVEWMQQMMAGERAAAVDNCITCYACNEICPQQANPFDLIASLQEKYAIVPREMVAHQEQQFQFSGDLNPIEPAERIMSICVFGKTDGHPIQGELYDPPQIGGRPYFCWVLFSHEGAESVQRKHAAEFVERLSATGAKEIVCFHDDCYAMLAKLAPEYGIEVPFRPVHLSEYLVEYLRENRDRITPLNLEIAYQRPCASRHTPEKEPFIDELFEMCGVKRVARKFDRENALCCAGVKMLLGKGDIQPDQEKNLQDAREAGAKAMVMLCPMCMHSMAGAAKEFHMPMIFLGDIARMALGEMKMP